MAPLYAALSCLNIFAGLQHIFREDGKSLGRIIDKHMGNRADESSILQDRRAAHPLYNPARLLQQFGDRLSQ